MMIYALAALDFYSMIYQIETVKTVIAQPRLSADPSVYTLTAEELRAFGHEVWAKSKLILDGKGNSSRRQQRVGSAGREPYAKAGLSTTQRWRLKFQRPRTPSGLMR